MLGSDFTANQGPLGVRMGVGMVASGHLIPAAVMPSQARPPWPCCSTQCFVVLVCVGAGWRF